MAETAWLSAQSNDFSYDTAPSKLLEDLGSFHDILVVISGSGNSPKILSALRAARTRNMMTIGFLGFGGGQARNYCDHAIVLPQKDYGPLEDCHSVCLHMLQELLR